MCAVRPAGEWRLFFKFCCAAAEYVNMRAPRYVPVAGRLQVWAGVAECARVPGDEALVQGIAVGARDLVEFGIARL